MTASVAWHPGWAAALVFLTAEAFVAPASAQATPSPSREVEGDPATRARARAHYRRGIERFREQDYPAAMAEFQKAEQLAPAPLIRFNIARTADRLGRVAAAYRGYRDFLKDSRGPEGARRIATERKTELASRVGTIDVVGAPDGAEVVVDYRPVGTTPLQEPVVVAAGSRRVTVSRKGFTSLTRVLDVAGRDRVRLEAALAPVGGPEKRAPAPKKAERAPVKAAPAPVQSPRPAPAPEVGPSGPGAAFWVVGGLTIAAAATGAAFGYLALEARDDHDAELRATPADNDAIAIAAARASDNALVADILFGVAGAGAVATVILYFATTPSGESTTALSVGPRWVGVTGNF